MLQPYMSTAEVNGREMRILRDTGATIDVVSKNNVSRERLTVEIVWVNQPPDNHSKCLPLASFVLKSLDYEIQTKAAVLAASLDQGYYILGNYSAE